MKFGIISISKGDDGRWGARIKNDIDSATGFGETIAEAFKNLAGCLDGGTMGERLIAWEAFSAGVDMDTRDTPSEAFEAWWSKR